ncbi:MAG TPA: recombinase [Franconibacter pulveris]|nr:recombinase [Franconibacter pulveris]
MKLPARQIDTAKPKDKAWKLAGGGGMYLEIFPNGTKSWRMKYRIGGKEKRVVYGGIYAYPVTFFRFLQQRFSSSK